MMSSQPSPCILCPTARLVQSLQQAYHQAQLAKGLTQWQALPVKTLDNWLAEVINIALINGDIDITHAPINCLTPMQERLIWQEVIATTLNNAAIELFDLTGLADICIEANQYVVAWRLELTYVHDFAEETRNFLQWRSLFQAKCKQLHVLETVRYRQWQLECLRTTKITLPAEIQFAGFLSSNPQEQYLRDILIARGCLVSEYEAGLNHAGVAQHLIVNETEDEIRCMVAWAKAKLDETPTVKLAFVVPQLSELRNRIADLVDDIFQPSSLRPSMAEVTRLYNFSLGSPLAQQPIIHAALQLIRLFFSRQINQQDISSLLRSSYWSASLSEADNRALLDAAMREALPESMNWPRLMRFFQQQAKCFNIQHLLAETEAALLYVQSQKRKVAPSVLAEIFRQLLSLLQWSGERSESSHEYQAKQAWEDALAQLASLDLIATKLSAQEACTFLTQICQTQVFQPKTSGEPAIQILGIMEALAAPVDALWVMGMTDDIWPPPARPNPLLPANIQRTSQVANADSAVQTAFAQGIHQRLIHCAKDIMFSSSLKQGEKSLRASPLVKEIAQYKGEIFTANTLAETIVALGNAQMTLVDDHIAPVVAEGEHVRGGTGLFKAQAVCPAWAFYQYRLGAKSLKTPKNGLDNADRGQLVHAALEQFWQKHTLADLQNAHESSLQAAIASAASMAIAEFAKQYEAVISEQVFALEQERLCKLLTGWLGLEKSRELTFTVLAREEKKKLMIQGIEVTVIIDRIDQFDDGSLLLIDYKTGRQPDIKNWAHSRITEPQLPIYAAFSLQENESIVAVSFGMVKTAEHAFSGLSDEQLVQGIKPLEKDKQFVDLFPDWQSLQSHWRTSLEQIACEIKSGFAVVQFADEKELQYCEVLPLLRLPERQLQFERQLSLGGVND